MLYLQFAQKGDPLGIGTQKDPTCHPRWQEIPQGGGFDCEDKCKGAKPVEWMLSTFSLGDVVEGSGEQASYVRRTMSMLCALATNAVRLGAYSFILKSLPRLR